MKHKLYQITASIVAYNNPIEEIEKAINSFLNTKLKVKNNKNRQKLFIQLDSMRYTL